MKMRKITGGVTAAKGFKAACCAAGIKYQNRTDMAMIAADIPCAVAGVFTSNMVKAAPVLWDRAAVQAGKPVQAVVVNAGIANAGTGEEGMNLCRQTAEHTGKVLGIPADTVLMAVGMKPRRAEALKLAHLCPETSFYIIGDAVRSGEIRDAVFQSFEVTRTI